MVDAYKVKLRGKYCELLVSRQRSVVMLGHSRCGQWKHQIHPNVFKPDFCDPFTFSTVPCIVAAALRK